MALLDHFSPNAGPVDTGGNGVTRVAVHEFTSVIAIANEGTFGGAAAALTRIKSEFGLDSTDDAQLALIRDELTSRTTKEDKNEFIIFLERGLIAFGAGHITQAELVTYLGI